MSWNSETLSDLCEWWPFSVECVKNKWKAGAELWVPSSGKLMHATFNWWLIIIFCSSLIFHIDFFYLQPMIHIYDTYLAPAIDCSSFDPIVRLAIFLVMPPLSSMISEENSAISPVRGRLRMVPRSIFCCQFFIFTPFRLIFWYCVANGCYFDMLELQVM